MTNILAACIAGCLSTTATANPPQRVVSTNLCTDQLAMLLSDPSQLISISWLSQDAGYSSMVAEAAQYETNRGQAEEIFTLNPDLVVAGTFSSSMTNDMLMRLGKRVEVFPPIQSFDDFRQQLTLMGALLGRSEKAAEIIKDFDEVLARTPTPPQERPRAVTYAANNYSTGSNSLTHEVMEVSGYTNIGAEFNTGFGGRLSLEDLVLSKPDVIVTGDSSSGTSAAEAALHHPAFKQLRDNATSIHTDQNWACGTPDILHAIQTMIDARP